MFDDWMNVWRETLDSFDRELHAGAGGADRHAQSMRRQLNAARSALTQVDEEIAKADRDAAAERESEQVCIRRRTMAEGIADEETARIAAEYAARHAVRADVYERKAAILREERAMMAEDLDVMETEFAAHVKNIDAAADDDDAATSRMLEEDDDERRDRERHDAELARMRRERAASEKLEELKRRMRS